jgi:hypothetical protein
MLIAWREGNHASPTIWGKSPPLRQAAAFLLLPAEAWIISATASAVIIFAAGIRMFVPIWMAITAIGLLYFYITLRGADVEARHKVLWFVEAALAAAISAFRMARQDLGMMNGEGIERAFSRARMRSSRARMSSACLASCRGLIEREASSRSRPLHQRSLMRVGEKFGFR